MFQTSYRSLKSIIKHVLGLHPTFPSLGSNTMEKDDLRLCRQWLKKPDKWFDEKVVENYTSQFALWNHSNYAYAFMGARVALSASIYALDLKPHHEVIIPGYTCIVVPNAFKFAEVPIVYSDIETDTYGLSIEGLEQKITSRTRAVLLHHLYGLVCRDYEKILALARKHNLYVIEDCAQCTGSKFKNQPVGNLGDVAIYSSEQSKAYTTGQGGIVTTNNEAIANKLYEFYKSVPFPPVQKIENLLYTLIYNYYAYAHPRKWFWRDWADYFYGDRLLVSTTQQEIDEIKPDFYPCKMPAPLADIGLNQLKKLDRFNAQRRLNAKSWDVWCEARGYKKPLVLKDSEPIFLRYPVMVEPQKKSNRDWAIKELNVRPGVWFVTHKHPAPQKVEGCPAADSAVAQCINFPTL